MSIPPPAPPKTRFHSLAALPVLGAAVLPTLTCPACWPAYAGLLSTLGLGFVDYTPYLMPLTLGFLGLALVALGHRSHQNQRYKPLVVGLVGAVALVIGKFIQFSDAATYSGIALVVGASLWNSWPSRRLSANDCPSCPPTEATS